MLGKQPNKVYDPFLKAGLGYKNPERLKKAIAAQPKMYHGEILHSTNLKIDSPYSEETLEDAEESLLKMRNKIVQLNYGKLNALYETFVPQQEPSVEQTYFSIPSTSNDFSESKEVTSDLPIPKMPKESKLLKMLEKIDLLMIIYKLKNKIKTIEKEKNVNTKFDKSETSGTLLYITRLPKNIAVKAKKVSNTKVNVDRITKTETQMLDSKTNMNVSNSTGLESSNSVRRSKSKDTKSKDRVLKNTTDKRPSAHVRKMSSNVSIDSNKRATMNSTICQSNTSVLNTKTINAVNDCSNIVCVSCGKDVFLISHEKCVARYALSRDSKVKRSLFSTPIVARSKNLGATSVVAKSRLSVAKTPTATNKLSSALPLSPDSSQSRTLSNYMKNKIATSRKWQKWFENQKCFNWTPKSKTAQSLHSETKSSTRVRSKSNTPVTAQKWVAKLSTLPSAFISCDAGDPARPLDC
ncbi:hypothetical protein Tco_0975971 [Tanacetum coccineum]|uniref:Uncharacterized protein n=1 Tax=Tanacetum coccineum TaxID=301880 RepID=A0ABQ5EFW5_9ASTR